MELAIISYNLTKNSLEYKESEDHIFRRVNLKIGYIDRFFIIGFPINCKPTNVILFFHGSRDLAWNLALSQSNLNKDNIVIFCQACTENIVEPHIHPDYGYISFGEIFWEIIYDTSIFKNDLDYVKYIIDYLYEMDINNIYAIGHSNGGVFVCLLAVYFPNVFVKLVSHQGGIGYDIRFKIPFELLDQTLKLTPILFYTGSLDIHKIVCEQAHMIFTNEGFKSELYIEPDLSHEYKSSCETYIINWLME